MRDLVRRVTRLEREVMPARPVYLWAETAGVSVEALIAAKFGEEGLPPGTRAVVYCWGECVYLVATLAGELPEPERSGPPRNTPALQVKDMPPPPVFDAAAWARSHRPVRPREQDDWSPF